MKNKFKRTISLALAALMFCNMTVGAFAGESLPVTETVQVETQAGSIEDVTVNVIPEATMAPDGTLTKKTYSANDYVTADNMIVGYTGTSHMLEYSDGVVTGTAESRYTSQTADGVYKAEGGSKIMIEKIVPQTVIEIPLEPGKTKTVSTQPGTEIVTGDKKTDDADGIYDYTTVTVDAPHTVTVATSDVSYIENSSSTPSELEHLKSATLANDTNDLATPSNGPQLPQSKEDVYIADDYQYVLLGAEIYNRFWPAFISINPGSAKDPIIFTDTNNVPYYVWRNKTSDFINLGLVVDNYFINNNIAEGTPGATGLLPARWSSGQQFVVTDRNANLATAYCVDCKTNA